MTQMNYRQLGQQFNVSALTMGGGGTGQVWGETTREEAIATTQLAYESGINLFDMAPLYGQGEAERVLALSFQGGYPDDVHVTTKCMVGGIPGEQIENRLITSLEESLQRMARSYVDVYILHGYVIPDGWREALRINALPHIAVEFSNYVEYVIPTFQKLIQQGTIGAFGVTAASIQSANKAVLNHSVVPDVVQCIANALDSPGNMSLSDEIPQPREIIRQANTQSIGVMGIRAVAAGGLTDKLDREVKPTSGEARDFARTSKFRQLAAEMGVSAAHLAHRYSLSMDGVDTVVLGVKNRIELTDCLQAQARGPLTVDEITEVDRSIES